VIAFVVINFCSGWLLSRIAPALASEARAAGFSRVLPKNSTFP
jgi:hypothetical protein